jgi:hypothetical protein
LFVYLPLIVRRNQGDSYKKLLKEMPLLEECREILKSELLTSPIFLNLKGSFMYLLQRWLDTLF